MVILDLPGSLNATCEAAKGFGEIHSWPRGVMQTMSIAITCANRHFVGHLMYIEVVAYYVHDDACMLIDKLMIRLLLHIIMTN